MPEGGEVYLMARELNQECQFSYLLGIEYDSNSKYAKSSSQHISQLNELASKTYLFIEEVSSYGKKIIFLLSDNNSKFGVVFSPLMTGVFLRKPDKHSNLWLNLGNVRQVGKLNLISKKRRVYFDDVRHFGLVECFFSYDDLMKRLKDVGPDLIKDDITPEMFIQMIRVKKYLNKKIVDVLLDSDLTGSIGNYLCSDVLYASRINPHRLVSNLTDEEITLILKNSKDIINSAIESGGYSLKDFRNLDGIEGNYQPLVFNRTKDSNGFPVIKEKRGIKGGRAFYWCPSVQK